jgi:hypothetical protein
MSWQRYLNNDMLEQEQLDSSRAVIEDATRDTVFWLQANPSAEERVHVLAIEERLAALDRIITRRLERRRSPEDEWVWPETVREVLLLLDNARDVRGHFVGKGLGRLADRLPRELPGPRPPLVSQAPTPPTRLRGGWTAIRAKPTQIPPNPPTYFPSDLWPKTVVILAEAVRKYPHQSQTLELCKNVISEMTPLFYEAVKAGKIKASAVLSEGFGGMADLLHSLLVYNDEGPHSGSSSLSDQAYRLGQEARKSDEWLKLAREVARVVADVGEASAALSRNTQFRTTVDAVKQRLMCDIQDVAGKLSGTPITLLCRSFLDGSQEGIREGFAQLFAIGQQFPTEVNFDPAKWAQVTAQEIISDHLRSTPYETCLPQVQSLLNRLAARAKEARQLSVLEFVPHAPLSNPLTALDSGSSATVDIESFTMRVPGREIEVNSGAISGVDYDTLYYVYFDDPNLFGGTVTYEATTTKRTVILVAGRFFVGSIRTPAKGGPPTIGNGDDGTFQSSVKPQHAIKSPDAPKIQVATASERAPDLNKRKSFVMPILEKKGWSVLEWATHSEVDFHTADNYLKDKTKSYKSTRTKLAKSLGVDVQELPS